MCVCVCVCVQLESSAQQLEDQRKRFAEVQDKFFKERAVRRRLHEQLQQLRGNIRVMCRWAGEDTHLQNQQDMCTFTSTCTEVPDSSRDT